MRDATRNKMFQPFLRFNLEKEAFIMPKVNHEGFQPFLRFNRWSGVSGSGEGEVTFQPFLRFNGAVRRRAMSADYAVDVSTLLEIQQVTIFSAPSDRAKNLCFNPS